MIRLKKGMTMIVMMTMTTSQVRRKIMTLIQNIDQFKLSVVVQRKELAVLVLEDL